MFYFGNCVRLNYLSLVRVVRRLLVCFLLVSHFAMAQTDPWKNPRTLVDRTILTVEKHIYTLSDVYIILALSNTAMPNEAISEISDWKELSGFLIDRNKPFLKQFEKWPSDVQRLIFVTLSYPELSKNPLNAPKEENKSALLAQIRKEQLKQTLPLELQQALEKSQDETILKLADVVLRAVALRKNKGSLRESSGSLNWFWHQRPLDINAQ